MFTGKRGASLQCSEQDGCSAGGLPFRENWLHEASRAGWLGDVSQTSRALSHGKPRLQVLGLESPRGLTEHSEDAGLAVGQIPATATEITRSGAR